MGFIYTEVFSVDGIVFVKLNNNVNKLCFNVIEGKHFRFNILDSWAECLKELLSKQIVVVHNPEFFLYLSVLN